MSYCKFRSIVIIVLSLLANPVFSEDLAIRVQDWLFIRLEQGNKAFCYATTVPYKTGLYHVVTDRMPFMQLTWRGDNQYTLSINSGYTLSDKSPITIKTVNYGSYQLKTISTDTGTTYSSIQDAYIINNLLQIEDYIKVASFDEFDAQAVDYYSMRGFVTALKLMQNNCS